MYNNHRKRGFKSEFNSRHSHRCERNYEKEKRSIKFLRSNDSEIIARECVIETYNPLNCHKFNKDLIFSSDYWHQIIVSQ